MNKLTLFAKLASVLPLVVSDLTQATEDKFVSLSEILKSIKDFLASTGLGNKIAIKAGEESITLTEFINALENFFKSLGLDQTMGFEIGKDKIKFVIGTPSGGAKNGLQP